ncbi:PREDICTED: uncharacterized protein LOC109343117 isoform X2 [Lupinus angustifolius]|uniref:uncharacterized protein LOC109343117 isoform X2 n=1 Tax=Lupinus angustifolius TaxID=3871 RepID=UPI00092F70CB|nr:PREDICTED: uncharacterized protein LOC109343117 isoform X2 [Lupinus angustifolius]
MTNEYATSLEICEYEDFNSSKRPKLTSKVWEDMERIQTSDGSKVLCKHCGKLLQDNCGTSHLKRHLVICLKRPKSADIITKNQMASVCHRGNGSGKEPGSNTVLMVRPLKVEPQSQITCFSETPKNHGALTLDDVEMKAFYASLDAEASVVTPPQDTSVVTESSNTTPCEESKKALKTLQDLLSKDFSILLHPGQSGTMKSTIEHLSKSSADDIISAELRLLLLEVSREFTRWSCDYNDASRKIESASTNILKADKLEEGLEANKNQFKEVLSLENDLTNQLASLEQKKKELEEQINAIKAHISVSQSAKNTVAKRKREIFEEAKTLKAQRDELREQLPHMRDECEVAKKIQANIKAEWSKLGEKVNKSLDGVNCQYLNQPQNV